jgi:hypothetical protein
VNNRKNYLIRLTILSFLMWGLLNVLPIYAQTKFSVLKTDQLSEYVVFFNSLDEEDVVNYVGNDEALDWLSDNIPLLECPDSIIQQTYYYRWWTFRKHLKETADGFIFTEFITPVGHAIRARS